MRIGRVGLAIALTATMVGTAWAALPGVDGLKQLKREATGQAPAGSDGTGLQSSRSGVNIRYVGFEPGFELSLPRDWKVYKSAEDTPGVLTYLASAPVDTKSSGGPQRWLDGTVRGDARRNDDRALLALQPSGMIVRIGRGLAEKDLKDVRVFAPSKRLVVADNRRVELYAYRLTTTDLGSSFYVAVATTTASDASKGAVDFHLIYYPRPSEGDGMQRLESVARTFRSLPEGTPPEPVSKRDRSR